MLLNDSKYFEGVSMPLYFFVKLIQNVNYFKIIKYNKKYNVIK